VTVERDHCSTDHIVVEFQVYSATMTVHNISSY